MMCGRITKRTDCIRVKPSVVAASISARCTDAKPARCTCVRYAPALSVIPINTAVYGENRMPQSGKAEKMK